MRPLRVGVLAYPGCFASEVFGVPDLLTMASHVAAGRGSSPPRYDTLVLSPRRSVSVSGGCAVAVQPMRRVDVLVVPGFECAPGMDIDARLADLRPEVATIRSESAAGVSVVSICVGAFLLAEAGVLDGRTATTSWLFSDLLARRYPAVTVRPDGMVVTDRGVTTTAAFTAMYDFALNLIREHDGPAVARRTARVALVDDAKSTQAPYVDIDMLPTTGHSFSCTVKRRLDDDLAAPYDLRALADTFHVSTRTLLRRFRSETGQSPLTYLQSARVHRAQHLLETTGRTVASIAAGVGYSDPSTFSTVFARHAGRRPRDYRATFRRDASAAGNAVRVVSTAAPLRRSCRWPPTSTDASRPGR